MSIWTRFLARSSVVERGPVKSVVVGSNPTVPAISRRSFLKYAAAAPAVTYFLAPSGGWRPWQTLDLSKYLTSNTAWFLKTEHADGIALFNRSHPRLITSARFAEILRPGLERIWIEEYEKHEDEWKGIYGSASA